MCDCAHAGLQETFPGHSEKDAKRYRKRGLDARGRKLLNAVARGVELRDKTLLEAGIGVGALTLELLKRGLRNATGVDVVPEQLQQADKLAHELGLADRLTLVQGDFTELPQLPQADIVVLDRVVCCYPDWAALLDAAAKHADAMLALSYPREVWWMRWAIRTANLGMRVMRRQFRLYLHPPGRMFAFLHEYRFAPRVVGYHAGWEIAIAKRAA